MTRLFGTDGVRGLAGVAPMNVEVVLKLGMALAAYIKQTGVKHNKILIGKDTRVSGSMLENALLAGICSMGVDVLLVGLLPTPGVAFMTRSMLADAGVVITASHNSYEDNGIKIFGANGFKLPDAVEDELESLMKSERLDLFRAKPAEIGRVFRIDDAVGRYAVFLKSSLKKNYPLEGLKVILDTANGAAYKVAPLVFKELGAELVVIGDKPDGKNINAGVGSLYPENVAQLVVQHQADIGIALDGDGDRLILADEKGNIVKGDHILAVLALHFKEAGKLQNNGLVGTVMSNLGVELALREQGINFVRTAVGERYVLEQMLKDGYNLGGEPSGHFVVLDYNTAGDGILAVLMFLSIMIETGKSVSELAGLIKSYPQILLNIKVAHKPPLESLPKLQEVIKKSEQILTDSGRILVRYSGTENKVRVMVEAQDAKLCESVAQNLAEIIKVELGN
ncbi:MAG: phosphoglucosamine mutase [Deltaproteobacteria bacterium]|jgi:phosphoglucosamine mutase|nr:phosphoglucosamine mutase [Deltaproteobacteria bacterium]